MSSFLSRIKGTEAKKKPADRADLHYKDSPRVICDRKRVLAIIEKVGAEVLQGKRSDSTAQTLHEVYYRVANP